VFVIKKVYFSDCKNKKIKLLLMEWYLKVLRMYAEFNGRARRKEFWMFFVFNLLFSFCAMAIDNLTGYTYSNSGTGLIYSLYSLFVFIPGLAVWVRRLHDTGRSAWAILMILVPFVGWVFMIIWLSSDSEKSTNEYGPNPKK
jgi:uncharacterized membrane protein YhaH (DUF805 family)